MAVVDASVMVARSRRQDAHYIAASRFLNPLIQGVGFDAPTILATEVASGVSQAGADPSSAIRVQRWLMRHDRIRLHPVTRELASRAAEIAAWHGIRGCDAVYVALAETLGTELVTFDGQQRERGATVVPTRTPRA